MLKGELRKRCETSSDIICIGLSFIQYKQIGLIERIKLYKTNRFYRVKEKKKFRFLYISYMLQIINVSLSLSLFHKAITFINRISQK